MDLQKIKHWPAILFLPLVVLAGSWIARAVSGPFWQFGDPPYNYFFNGVLLFKGHVPTDITHPGTPLQMLIALTMRILNLGHTPSQAIDRILTHPEIYLYAVYTILTLAVCGTSILLGAYVYRKTGDYAAVLLSQLIGLHFLIMPSFDSGAYPVLPVAANINAEPCFIIAMNLFNLGVLGLYFSRQESQKFRYTVLLGLVCGFGMASKLNFLFIVLAGFLLVPLKRKWQFCAGFLLSFVLFTIPIISRYHELLAWANNIVDHSSRYGTGDKKFIDWHSFFFYIGLIMQLDWFFPLLAAGLTGWALLRLAAERGNKKAWYALILLFCWLLHFLATAKHFSFHYLLPAFCLFGSILPLCYLDFKDRCRLTQPLALAFVAFFAGACLLEAVPYYKKLLVLTGDIRQFNSRVEAKFPGSTIIPATTGDIDLYTNQQEALQRGNGTAFRVEGDDLYRLYPHSYYFFSEEVTSPDNVESYGIWDYKKRVWGEDIVASCPFPIFIKFHADMSDYPYQVQLVDQSRYFQAYLITNSTEKKSVELFNKSLEAMQKGNARQALMLAMASRQLHYQPEGQLEYVLESIYNYVKSQRP